MGALSSSALGRECNSVNPLAPRVWGKCTVGTWGVECSVGMEAPLLLLSACHLPVPTQFLMWHLQKHTWRARAGATVACAFLG